MSAAQFRAGDRSLRPVPRDPATVIHAGDFLFLDSGKCKPANAFTWTTNLATTQTNFAAVFLGIATTSHIADDTADCQVDMGPEGIWACSCVLNTFYVGDMITMAQDGVNSLLSSTVVQKTATTAAGIGRVFHYVDPADTSVAINIGSAFGVGTGHKAAEFGA